jgi:hypothetical protein
VLRRVAPHGTESVFGAVCQVLFPVASAAPLEPEVGAPQSANVAIWSNSSPLHRSKVSRPEHAMLSRTQTRRSTSRSVRRVMQEPLPLTSSLSRMAPLSRRSVHALMCAKFQALFRYLYANDRGRVRTVGGKTCPCPRKDIRIIRNSPTVVKICPQTCRQGDDSPHGLCRPRLTRL